MQELIFNDLVPKTIPVKINNKRYILKEATGGAACQYRNAILSSTRLGGDGRPSNLVGMADTEPLLISLCLYEILDDGTERRVPKETILAWPYRIQRTLYDRVREISGLGEEDTEESLLEERKELDEKLARLNEQKQASEGNGSDGMGGSVLPPISTCP